MAEKEEENLEEKNSPEMETPLREQNNDNLPKFDESPVFDFINNLSPLKMDKSLRISQSFNSFSFQSVASVFTSPQLNTTKGAELLKKHSVPDLSTIHFSFENENKGCNPDLQKESTHNGSKLPIEPVRRVPDEECLLEGTLRTDVSLVQETSVIRDIVKTEEAGEGDWERLISNAGDYLIYNSPNDTSSFKDTSMCKSLMPEFTVENTNELQNAIYVNANRVEQSESEPPAELVDNEPFPNLQRGMRRRCLVYEMGGNRKKQLEESSSSGPITSSPYGSGADYVDKHFKDSTSCIVSGIGLHLNALAKTSRQNCFDHERRSANDFGSYGSHLSVGPGQIYLDQPITVASMERSASVNKNEVLGADQAFGYAASEDINQISPKKKRRKMDNDGENEGCKRCNCKKSKCLKLYCECFAAGVYCVEPCTCQECFNKPIHEETVLAARKQIESRNPLAFAPKVIRNSESAVETRDDSSTTPASARHKRGCNCKKSGCLKKYCECYQEGVGCSINCRCEGCKNAFGRKDGSVPVEADVELDEDEIEARENIVMDQSLHENLIHNGLQQFGKNCFPATPLRFPRDFDQLPSSSRLSSLAIGSSSTLDVNRDFPSTSFLQPHLEFEKRNEALQGGEMPEILQGNGSSLGLIKSSSPNKKRISPPHIEFERSPNRTTSRKLILQSIPSFPSLTPKQ